MSLLAAFMVPHPPMIIPEVGGSSRDQIKDTIQAYENVAKEIAALKPDTIIFSSPHSVMYRDYFHISPKEKCFGNFSRFGAREVAFEETYDEKLAKKIEEIARNQEFPAGFLGERDPMLDHGVMVPLWFIRREYQGGKIIRIGLSGLSLADHYRFGMMINEAIEICDRRCVYIASGDLSHKLQDYGPYGFVKEGPEYDERIMDVMSRASFGELFDFDEAFLEKAAECGHRSFVIMAGALDSKAVKPRAYSHEDVTGVGYGICSFYPEGEDESRNILKQYEEKYQ